MHIAVCNFSSSKPQLIKTLLLILAWSAGFLCGCIAMTHSDVDISLMLSAASGRMSIVGLVCVCILPFLLTAFAVSIHQTFWIIFLAFLKAFCLGFCFLAFKFAFGDMHWFYRALVLFSDLVCVWVLSILWFKVYVLNTSFHAITVSALVCLGFGLIDYCYISPFLADIINH